MGLPQARDCRAYLLRIDKLNEVEMLRAEGFYFDTFRLSLGL